MKELKNKVDGLQVDIAIIKEKQDHIEDIKKSISDIKVVLHENTESLKDHMLRTSIAEKNIEINSKRQDSTEKTLIDVSEKVSGINLEIKEHLAYVNGGIKVIAIIVGAITLLNKLGIL